MPRTRLKTPTCYKFDNETQGPEEMCLDEKRAPLKTPAWEASYWSASSGFRLLGEIPAGAIKTWRVCQTRVHRS